MDGASGDGGSAPRPDLRMSLLGVAAWAGALAAALGGPATLLGWVVVALLGLVLAPRHRLPLLLAFTVVGAGVAGAAVLRADVTRHHPVALVAEQRAVGTAEVVLSGDPVRRAGRFGAQVVARGHVHLLSARGTTVKGRAPVLLIADELGAAALGSRLVVTVRVVPADASDLAAVLLVLGEPESVDDPSAWLRGAGRVRAAVRSAAQGWSGDGAVLVPALVTGDDQRLPEAVVEDFRTAGLTHLTAVSGTNLTLVLGALMVLVRALGAGGRTLLVVGLVGVAGFVLVARPEPSVVRAAGMGTVALLGMGAGGRAAGVRALGVVMVLLLLLDPRLGTSLGFALSVLATAGILFVGPAVRDALAAWLPRWAAEALAVPLAAQVACTPLVAAISGEVSLVAVLANVVVAPLVGPATVLGLAGGLVGLAVPAAGSVLGWAGAGCAQGIVEVAGVSARLPAASVEWGDGPAGLTVLTLLCLLVLLGAGRLLRHRGLALGAGAVLVLAILVPLPSPGWPPPGWVLVMCDVGQGDALVLATGPGEGILVDAGPEPARVDDCLRRLRISRLPAVVLTHFHADHVDGLPGALRGREVGEVQVTALRDPEEGAVQVERWAGAAGVPLRIPAYAEERSAGPVTWRLLGPRRLLGGVNDASLTLLVETAGIRVLLSGDVEPVAQAALLAVPGLAPVDVLKVPHHGSRHQDERLLGGLGARLALVPVGADNDYGHPAPETLAALRSAGALVRRTDQHGDVAVVVAGDGTLRAVARGGAGTSG